MLQDDSSGTIRLVIFYISYAMFLLQFALSFVVDYRKKPRSNRPPDEQTFLLSAKIDDIVDAVSTLIVIAVILNIPRTLNASILGWGVVNKSCLNAMLHCALSPGVWVNNSDSFT